MVKYDKKMIVIGALSVICIILVSIMALNFTKLNTLNKELINTKQQLVNSQKKVNEPKNELTQLQEKFDKLKDQNTKLQQDYDSKVQLAESIQKKLDNIESKNSAQNAVATSGQTNNKLALTEKEKMVDEAKRYFADRGVKVSNSGYSEMVGTNLNSGISELEGHRVFAFTIENYDIKDNNVWFYYSPETKVGYRYQNEKWTKVK